MNCKICNTKTINIFESKILKKYNIKYFKCENCGFLQTEEPYWLKEVYSESINKSDTGILSRNLHLAKQASVIIYFLFNKDSKFLDFAGGYGTFVRLMRDIGLDFYWCDAYSKNFFARGFEYDGSIKDIELITSFESFEHFTNPIKEIETMLSISSNIIFSTELLPDPVPAPSKWWYYGLNHGQHVSFYSLKTLKIIAQKYRLNLCSNNKNLHLITPKVISKPIFKILIKAARTPVFWWVKKQLQSKTWQDHLSLKRHNDINDS